MRSAPRGVRATNRRHANDDHNDDGYFANSGDEQHDDRESIACDRDSLAHRHNNDSFAGDWHRHRYDHNDDDAGTDPVVAPHSFMSLPARTAGRLCAYGARHSPIARRVVETADG